MVRLLCSAALVAASGCIIIGNGHGGDIPCGHAGHDHETDFCARDRDCDDGAVCIDNRCRKTCAEDAGCGDEHRCFRGLCEGNDQHPACERHSDCAVDRVCDTGACLARCEDDIDCPGLSDLCNDGTCVPPAAPGWSGGGTGDTGAVRCRASCECPEGQECTEGKCAAPPPQTQSCTVDCECPSGQKCVEGACA